MGGRDFISQVETDGDEAETEEADDEGSLVERDEVDLGEFPGGDVAGNGEDAGDDHGIETLNGVTKSSLGEGVQIDHR